MLEINEAIKFSVLKQNLLDKFALISNILETDPQNRVHKYVYMEISTNNTLVLCCLKNGVSLKKVEVGIMLDTHINMDISFLIHPFMFTGFINGLSGVDKLDFIFDGKKLICKGDETQSSFTIIDSSGFFFQDDGWRHIPTLDGYIFVNKETLQDFIKGFMLTSPISTAYKSGKKVYECVEVCSDSLVTSDESSYVQYRLCNPLPINDGDSVLLKSKDFNGLVNLLEYISSGTAEDYEINFLNYNDSYQLLIIKTVDDSTILTQYFTNTLPYDFNTLLENVLTDEGTKTLAEFEVDYPEFCTLLTMFSKYEHLAKTSSARHQKSTLSIDKENSHLEINIDGITEFKTEIKLNRIQDGEIEFLIKSTQLLKTLSEIKQCGKLNIRCLSADRPMLLFTTEEYPTFRHLARL
jgi:hypothetical protein